MDGLRKSAQLWLTKLSWQSAEVGFWPVGTALGRGVQTATVRPATMWFMMQVITGSPRWFNVV